jgi:uncharacterized membrane protein
MSAVAWQVLLFMVLPLVGIYIGLTVWSVKSERRPRR